MRARPTIVTVAKRAGVAVSTVSRYLNGHYASPAVKARLATIIKELGYAPSWTARNLSFGRRGCIGVVVGSSRDPWFVEVFTGIEQELLARDTSLRLCSLDLRSARKPAIVLEWIRDRRIDGLIVVKSQRSERALLRAAVKEKLPTVTVAPQEILPMVQVVRCNDVAAGETAANYLVDLGHRQIGFVRGAPQATDSQLRLKGFRQGLAKRRICYDPRRVYCCGRSDEEAGSTFAKTFLKSPLQETALVLANDALALGFMTVARDRGIGIPQELSIVGFDGLPQGATSFPQLTTVAQPMREMGRAACGRLFEVIAELAPLETIELPMGLLPRGSSGPWSAMDRHWPTPRRPFRGNNLSLVLREH